MALRLLAATSRQALVTNDVTSLASNFQYANGLLDEQTSLAYRHVILINHSTGRGRAWWDDIGREIVDPAFAELVDELLVDAKPDDTYKRMASWANR